MNNNNFFRITLSNLILICIINFIAYNFLPNEVGMQLSISGELTNFVPKIMFVIILPVLLGGVSLILFFRNSMFKTSPLIINALFLGIELFTLYVNLK
ncbi:MAG: DUF1648 domain-containing protein [Sarcina sp.]